MQKCMLNTGVLQARSYLAAGSDAEELPVADLVSSGGGSPGWARRAYPGFFFFLFFKSLTMTGKCKTPASINLLMEVGKGNRLCKSQINRDLSLEAVEADKGNRLHKSRINRDLSLEAVGFAHLQK
jgi:hypothetical protein